MPDIGASSLSSAIAGSPRGRSRGRVNNFGCHFGSGNSSKHVSFALIKSLVLMNRRPTPRRRNTAVRVGPNINYPRTVSHHSSLCQHRRGQNENRCNESRRCRLGFLGPEILLTRSLTAKDRRRPGGREMRAAESKRKLVHIIWLYTQAGNTEWDRPLNFKNRSRAPHGRADGGEVSPRP